MDQTRFACVLVLLINSAWPVLSNLITFSPPPCNKNETGARGKCFLTAACENCSQTEVKCYEDKQLQPLYQSKFKDAFCGPHGIVVVKSKVGSLHTLVPLKCRNGSCPHGSGCVKNPDDEKMYCCSTGSDANSKCVVLDLLKTVKKPFKQRIVDENGDPVNISRITIVLENTDVRCLQGWTYIFKGDTIYLSNGCRVQFQICYDAGTPLSTNKTDLIVTGQICDRVHLLSRASRPAERTFLDVFGSPLAIQNMRLLEQLSESPCLEGESYTFQGSVARATGGCKGIFNICYNSDTNLTSSAGNLTDVICRNVIIKCKDNQHVTRNILDKRYKQVNVVSMGVVKQISQAPCVERKNFHFQGSKVIVIHGCHAKFEICYTGSNVSTTASSTDMPDPGETCETIDLSSTHDLPAEKTFQGVNGNVLFIRSVELLERFSAVRCVEGETYIFSSTVVRATDGCRATFNVCHDLDESHNQPTTNMVTPTTEPKCHHVTLQGQKRERVVKTYRSIKNIPVRVTSMHLVKQLSNVHCQEWFNYYFEGNTILAKGGCFADFEICFEKETAITPPSLIEVPGPGRDSRLVNLFSLRNRPAQRTITDVRGNNVTVRNMTLVLERSNAACVKGVTFNFSKSEVVASNGCSGFFRISFDVENYNFTAPQGQVCDKEVILLSSIAQADQKSLNDSKANPLVIRSMLLVEQFSDIRCVMGDSYNFYGSVVSAFDGCRGAFKICYQATEISQTTETTTVEPDEPCQIVKLLSSLAQAVKKTFKGPWRQPLIIISVKCLDQISDIKCIEGDTYKLSTFVLEVSDGCQGTFEVCLDKGIPLKNTVDVPAARGQTCQIIDLLSKISHPAKKTVRDSSGNPLVIKSVTLVEELSEDLCVEGDTYDVYGFEVRATDGCQGSFQVCFDKDASVSSPEKNPTDEGCVTLTIRSSPDKPKEIEVTDKKSKKPVRVENVEVLKQISDVPCIEWETFEYEDSRVRVTDGCCAVFKICYEKKSQQDEECVTLTLSSSPDKPKVAMITDKKSKKPVRVENVEVLKQISDVPCVDWETFEYEGSRVRVTDGCGAVFKICYHKKSLGDSKLWL